MNRRGFIVGLIAAAYAGDCFAQAAPSPPAPLVFYANQPGRLTRDKDRQGGNPFASALVETLKGSPKTLEEFTFRLSVLNMRNSRGWQRLQPPKKIPAWKMNPVEGQTRVALVVINADYSKSDAYSLQGAAFDAQRVPQALTEAGFETTVVLDANAEGARKALAEFAALSETADASLIYVGGHGVQHKRDVYLMMGDYPERDPKWLGIHAIALDEIGGAGRARDINLVLYASCRDDPFSGY